MTFFKDKSLKLLIPVFSFPLIFSACSLSESPSFSSVYADLSAAGFSDSTLEGSVNALMTWDYADELSVNVARSCSSAPAGTDCGRYMRKASEFLLTLEKRCSLRQDGLSCGKGALLATHLQRKTSFYDSSDNHFFSYYFIKMVKRGCALNDAASCDDYGYQFLSMSDRLPLISHDDKVEERTALKYFEKACSLGNVTSCERLAALYETGSLLGLSVNSDRKLSEYYTQKACSLNISDMINPSRCAAASKNEKD